MMESEQIEKKISWLDEQHRKDNETISRLTERLTSVEVSISRQSQQFEELSSELTRLAGLAKSVHQMDDSLAKQRQEISRQLQDAAEKRSEKEKLLEDVRKADQKSMTGKLDDLLAKYGVVEEIKHGLDNRRDEEIRMSSTVDALEKRVDDLTVKDEDRERTIISLQEGRNQDTRSLGELQAKAADTRKVVDTLRGELDSDENRIRRLEVQVSSLSASEQERQEAHELWTEQQNRKQVEFERIWKEWGNRFVHIEKLATDFEERMVSYEETYRSIKQLQSDLDDVLQRLERRINEITEMQNLVGDRMKQDWSSFQMDDQKRWSTYKLTTDEQWRDHNRLHEKIGSQLQILDENTSDAVRKLSEFKETGLPLIVEVLSMLRTWIAELE
jgi:chromosome segregation ATPase